MIDSWNASELIEIIRAADIYVTPYLNEAQVVSGTLAYAVGAGKAVVSTPYWHAQEMLSRWARQARALQRFQGLGAADQSTSGLSGGAPRDSSRRL